MPEPPSGLPDPSPRYSSHERQNLTIPGTVEAVEAEKEEALRGERMASAAGIAFAAYITKTLLQTMVTNME